MSCAACQISILGTKCDAYEITTRPADDTRQRAAARIPLIVWCKYCGHRLGSDSAEMAARYGADTPVLDSHDRLLCSGCGGRQVDMPSPEPSGDSGDTAACDVDVARR